MDDAVRFVKIPQQLTFWHGNLVFHSILHRLLVIAHKPTVRTKRLLPDIVRKIRVCKGMQAHQY